MPAPPCRAEDIYILAARRPLCPRKARALRCLETPMCGTEPAPGRGGQIGGPGPWKGASPRWEPALSQPPPLSLAQGRGLGLTRRPSCLQCSDGCPVPCLLLSVCGSPGASSSFLPGSPPVATLQPNSVVLLGVAASQHLVLWSLQRFLQPRERRRALLSWALFLCEEHTDA